MEKLKSLGFDPSLFVGAITSGELTHRYLQRLVNFLSFNRVKLLVFVFYICNQI